MGDHLNCAKCLALLSCLVWKQSGLLDIVTRLNMGQLLLVGRPSFLVQIRLGWAQPVGVHFVNKLLERGESGDDVGGLQDF